MMIDCRYRDYQGSKAAPICRVLLYRMVLIRRSTQPRACPDRIGKEGRNVPRKQTTYPKREGRGFDLQAAQRPDEPSH